MSTIRIELRSDRILVEMDGGKHVVDETSGMFLRAIGEECAQARNEVDASLGRKLWQAIVGDRELTVSGSDPTRLTIREEAELAEALSAIPWEAMVEPGLDLPVAIHPQLVVSRAQLEASLPPAPPEGPAPLRVLIVDFIPREGCSEAVEKLFDELRNLIDDGFLEILILGDSGPPEPEEIHLALQRMRPHLVHDLGEGKAVEKRSRIARLTDFFLHLEAPPRLLIATAAGSDGQRLVEWRRLYSNLASFGILGLLGVAAEHRERFLQAGFWRSFYTSLARGRTLASAVSRASHALIASDLEQTAPFPLLYSDAPEARLVQAPPRPDSPVPDLESIDAPLPRSPFKGLLAYGPEDAGAYLGREAEIREVLALLRQERRLIVFGRSGVGKSSFLGAGLLFRLARDNYDPVYRFHYDAPPAAAAADGSEPPTSGLGIAEILDEVDRHRAAAGDAIVPVLLDQVEDLSRFPERKQLLWELFERTRAAEAPCALLLAVRSDFLSWLKKEISQVSFDTPPREIEIRSFAPEKGREILGRLAGLYSFKFQNDLLEDLLRDLADRFSETGEEILLLPQFSWVLEYLYRRRRCSSDGDLLLREEYRQINVGELLSDQLDQCLSALGETTHRNARHVLVRLIDAGTDRPLPRTIDELETEGGVERETVREILRSLVGARLMRELPHDRYELVTELLTRAIREKFLHPTQVARDQARTRLRTSMAGWKATAEPLPLDFFQDLHLSDLSPEELGYLFGSILLHEPSTLDTEWKEVLLHLPQETHQSIVRDLRSASHPKVLGLALVFAAAKPPHVRGPSPIALKGRPGFESHTRYFCEAILPALARYALGSQTKDGDPQKEVRRKQKETLELLRETISGDEPLAGSFPDLLTSFQNLLGTWGYGLTYSKQLPLDFWPGPWVSPLILALTFVFGTSLASHLIWPAAAQRPAELVLVWLVTGMTLLASSITVTDFTILTLIDPRLATTKFKPDWMKRRLRILARPLYFSLFLCCFAYFIYQLLGSFSNWLDDSFFTFERSGGILRFLSELPDSAIDLCGRFRSGMHDFLTGLPLAGGVFEKAFAFFSEANFIAKIPLFIIYLVLGFYLVLIVLMVVFSVQFLMPGIALFPAVALVALGCIHSDRVLFRSASRPRFRRGAELLAGGVLLGLGLPPALDLASQILDALIPYLWQRSVFFGEGHPETWAGMLGRAAESPAAPWVAAATPTLLAIILNVLGSRPLRMRLGRLNSARFWKPNEESLRPLVAEGTSEALRYTLDLIDRSPGVRGSESFYLTLFLALGELSPSGDTASQEESYQFAERAKWLLYRFDDRYFQIKGLLESLDEKIRLCDDESRRDHLQSLKQLIEMKTSWWQGSISDLPPATETTRGETESAPIPVRPPGRFRPLLNLLRRFGMYLFLIPLWGLFVHGFLSVAGFLISHLYPLGRRVGVSFTDFATSLDWLLRGLQILVFLLLVIGVVTAIQWLVRKARRFFRSLVYATSNGSEECEENGRRSST